MESENLGAWAYGRNDIRLMPVHLPASLGPHEVRVKIKAAGICGSDLHVVQHMHIAGMIIRQPMLLGHESAGIVIAVGSAVTRCQPGDRVAIDAGKDCTKLAASLPFAAPPPPSLDAPHSQHSEHFEHSKRSDHSAGMPPALCRLCESGRVNLCNGWRVSSDTPPVYGSLANEVVYPEVLFFPLPAHVSLEEGALCEPLSVAVHACIRAAAGGIAVHRNNHHLLEGAGIKRVSKIPTPARLPGRSGVGIPALASPASAGNPTHCRSSVPSTLWTTPLCQTSSSTHGGHKGAHDGSNGTDDDSNSTHGGSDSWDSDSASGSDGGSGRAILSGLSVAVIGGGSIGILCCIVAQAFGAAAVVLADVRKERVELARKHLNSSSRSGPSIVDGKVASSDGIDVGVHNGGLPNDGNGALSRCRVTVLLFDRKSSVEVHVAALQGASQHPIDVTIDCVGSEQSLSTALRATAAGGRVVLVGLKGGDMKLPVLTNVCAREVDLVGSFRACHTFETALQLLASKEVDVKWLVTHRLGFSQDEVEEGMRISAAEASAIKVMFAL